MNFIGINPVDALFDTAIVNGIVAPPLLVLIMLAARNPKVMGEQRIGPVLAVLGWLATIGLWLAAGGPAYPPPPGGPRGAPGNTPLRPPRRGPAPRPPPLRRPDPGK